MGRLPISLGSLVAAAIVQAIENDPSRTALSNDEVIRVTDVFGNNPPAPYTLRREMSSQTLCPALKRVNHEIAKHIHHIERWYAIDATYLKSPYYRGEITVQGPEGMMRKRSRSAKLFVARGLVTGIVAAHLVGDENTADQAMFVPLFQELERSGAIIRGGGILGDGGFNRQEHYDLVHASGGQAFLDFDRDSKASKNGEFPHYDEQRKLYMEDRDRWHAFFDFRALIETTNHAVKSLKRVVRAMTLQGRETEIQALIAAFNLTRLPDLRHRFRIDLPFVDERAVRYVEEALRRKRNPPALGTVEAAIEHSVADRTFTLPRAGWLRPAMFSV